MNVIAVLLLVLARGPLAMAAEETPLSQEYLTCRQTGSAGVLPRVLQLTLQFGGKAGLSLTSGHFDTSGTVARPTGAGETYRVTGGARALTGAGGQWLKSFTVTRGARHSGELKVTVVDEANEPSVHAYSCVPLAAATSPFAACAASAAQAVVADGINAARDRGAVDPVIRVVPPTAVIGLTRDEGLLLEVHLQRADDRGGPFIPETLEVTTSSSDASCTVVNALSGPSRAHGR